MPNEPNRRAQYDAMSTEELEEILRLDAQLPAGQESDEETIFYIMEVLARRRRNSDHPGKTVDEAWSSFQQHYLPKKAEKRACAHLRRWVAAAAVLAILVGIPTASGAFSWEKVWATVATWADGRFSFITTENPTIQDPVDDGHFKAFRAFLAKKDKKNAEVPMWIPDGFELKDITIDSTPISNTYIAFYSNGEKNFKIRLLSYSQNSSSEIEINNDILETYTTSGVVFYIFNNDTKFSTMWLLDGYECHISGDISLAELKAIIDSIEEG